MTAHPSDDGWHCVTCGRDDRGCWGGAGGWTCNTRGREFTNDRGEKWGTWADGAYSVRASEIKGLDDAARKRLSGWIGRVNRVEWSSAPTLRKVEATDAVTENGRRVVQWENGCFTFHWPRTGDTAAADAIVQRATVPAPSPDATRVVRVGRGRPLFVRGPLVPWREPQSA